MGEIATWSAVKTKVGLGKDSNECPTKAELLALSPTGTGENYVGLEISNASSYGNNETVQLSDIHKVTYKYTFTAINTTLNFPALGGIPTPEFIRVTSSRTKYIDGAASGSTTVSYTGSSLPTWITFESGGKYTAAENTSLNSRSTTLIMTQDGSSKTISVSMTQAAATQSWEYTLSHGVWNETDDLYTAIAGEYRTYLMDERSYKQEKRNGKNYGPQIPVPVTISSDSTWLTLNPTTFNNINIAGRDNPLIQTFQENKTLSRRYATITFTQAESGKKFTAKRYQAAGVKTYGNITITPTGNVPDIPASGGASHTFPYTWTQPWGWNGKTNDGGTLTTGGTETWNSSVSGSNLGTTPKARTKLGTRTVTVTCNGKSGTASKDVYQAANIITKTTQGAWEVSIFANPSTFTEQGGTSQISASARAPRTNTWSSGATNAASDATGTPTLSIPTAVTGFSLSGTTLTVAENTTSNQRRVVVRATMGTVYKEVTVTQSAYLVEWRYYFTTSTPTLNFDALGATKSGTISSYREKYINGSLVEGSREEVNILVKSMSAEIQRATAGAITMKENTTTQARTGTVVYEQVGSGKTLTITCNQAAGTREILYDIYWALSDRGNAPIKRVTSYTLDPAGEADRVHLILLCDEVTKINGTERFRNPISTGLSNLERRGPIYTRESDGEPSSLILDDGSVNGEIPSSIFPGQDYSNRGSTYQIVIGSSPNEDTYQQTIIMTYPDEVMNGSTPVGKVPDFHWVIDPIPYTRDFVFNWKIETGLITNITLSSNTRATNRNIISYVSLKRDNVEFTRKYIKPTFIPPSEDWLQIIDNGQNPDNTYNYIIKALTDNEGESARSQSVRFKQPGNGNQALQAYVSQEPSHQERERVTLSIGNYYAYGDPKLVMMVISWISPDGSDFVDGVITPGGHLVAHAQCGVEGNEINMNVIGKPEFGKPLKIKVGNICRAKETGDSMGEEITPLKISTRAGTNVDYVAESVFIDNFSQYFETSLSIINPTSGTGGTLQIEISLKNTYPGSMVDIQDWTFRPKDPNDPTIYLLISYGD